MLAVVAQETVPTDTNGMLHFTTDHNTTVFDRILVTFSNTSITSGIIYVSLH